MLYFDISKYVKKEDCYFLPNGINIDIPNSTQGKIKNIKKIL